MTREGCAAYLSVQTRRPTEGYFSRTHMAETTTNNSKPRVLVADDEQVIANTLAIILNQAGFEARAVYSGEKAIEALDTFKPDMMISDVITTSIVRIFPTRLSSSLLICSRKSAT